MIFSAVTKKERKDKQVIFNDDDDTSDIDGDDTDNEDHDDNDGGNGVDKDGDISMLEQNPYVHRFFLINVHHMTKPLAF